MPGTTPVLAIPFAEDSDPIKDGAKQTREMTARLEELLTNLTGNLPVFDTGIAVIPLGGLQSNTVTVPFNKTFTSPPIVVLTVQGGGGYWVVLGGSSTTTTTSIGIRHKDNANSNDSVNVRWLAVQL